MAAHKRKWLKELGLDNNDFTKIPSDENSLVWGLKNLLVSEQAYTLWACETYQLAAVKEEFFATINDFKIVEKFSQMHSWTPTCYPIYEWNNTLFIACLEPLHIQPGIPVCYVIAPYAAMTRTWKKFQKAVESIPEEKSTIQPPPPPMIEVPEVPLSYGADIIIPPPPPPPSNNVIEFPKMKDNGDSTLDDLDFSALASLGQHAIPPSPKMDEGMSDSTDFADNDEGGIVEEELDDKTPVTLSQIEKPTTKESTQTNVGMDFGQFTTATQTIHLKMEDTSMDDDLGIPSLEIDKHPATEFSLEDDPIPQKPSAKNTTTNKKETSKLQVKLNASAKPLPKPPQKAHGKTHKEKLDLDLDLPSLDNLKLQVAKKPDPPVLDKSQHNIEDAPEFPDLEHTNSNPGIHDEKIPPPQILAEFESDYGQPKPGPLLGPPADFKESTITDHALPEDIPQDYLITDDDMKNATDIKKCFNIKSIVSYIFEHIKKDYGMLMWIEPSGGGHYLPRYVNGDWQMTQKSWETPVNIVDANIFRIAFRSSLAFHGEISDNPANQKYFDMWTRGNKPNFATVFPVAHEDHCYGFIVGFIAGIEFSSTASLKKLTTLVSLAKPNFIKLTKQKAS